MASLWRFTRYLVAVSILSLSIGLSVGQTMAQTMDAAEDIARLSDEEVRRLLLEKLQTTTSGNRPDVLFNPAVVAVRFQRNFAKVKERGGKIVAAFAEFSSLPGRWWAKMTDGRDGRAFGWFFLVFIISTAIGLIAAVLIKRWLRNTATRSLGRHPSNTLSLATQAVGGLGVELAAVLVAGVTSTAVFFLSGIDDSRDRTFFFFLLAATLIVMATVGLSRVVLSPKNQALRIPMYTDKEARRLHGSIMLTIAFAAFGFFACASFGVLGIRGHVHELLLSLVGTGTAVLLSITICINRKAIGNDIMAGSAQPGVVRRMIAQVWPYVFSAVPILMWIALLAWQLLGGVALYGAALVTIVLLLLLPITESALSRVSTLLEAQRKPSTAVIARISRLGLFVVAVLILAAIWRVELFSATDTGLSAIATKALTQIASMVFICYAIWQVAKVTINRKIAEEDEAYIAMHGIDSMEAEQGGEGRSRARTLLPLLRRSIAIVLLVMAVLGALSALGVDTGPILAGAGVVGLAIGFGSQTLVRDIVTGFFFLMEDAFRIGEYVDVDAAKGTVEEISVRSMKLRHHRGALNTVPFGSVNVIKNFSRDWAIMKLRVRVPFETDLNMVRKLLKKVGQQMMEEEAIKDDFLQPFKAQGAVEVDDYGFVISTKFMSKPGKQFYIRRFAFQAMQDAFEEAGIPFARPKVRVEVEDNSSDESTPELAKHAASGAASAAVQQPKPAR